MFCSPTEGAAEKAERRSQKPSSQIGFWCHSYQTFLRQESPPLTWAEVLKKGKWTHAVGW